MYIFGKFEAFCKRLEKITEMITIVQTFSALSMSTIEGIDIMAIKFKNIYQSVQKKQYDILDPRKTEFDVDFGDFMTKIESLEVQIQTFMNTCFGRILSSQHSVQLLQRFQKLNMPCLKQEIAHTVGLILQHYVAELEATKKLYQAQKDDPPLARNMPPVAGKILWVRQLFRRISEPINFFYKHSDILTSPEGKAVVRLFNKISYVLVEFEVLYHMAWVKEISQLQYALQATLLVRHPETGKLLVNFDPKILEIVRETKCMIKMGLEVPEQAKRVVKMENILKANKLYLENLLQCYEDLCQEIPTAFVNLMAPKMRKVESVLRQGLTILTWSSLTLDSFFQEVDEVMNMFKQLLKKVNDLCEMQIDLIMKDISNTVLIVLPEDGPIKMEDMLARNETYTKEWAEILNHKSMHIEDAVQELISIFETIYEIKDSKKTLKKYSLPVKGKHVAFGGDGEEGDTDGSSGILSEDAEDNEKEDEFRKIGTVSDFDFCADALSSASSFRTKLVICFDISTNRKGVPGSFSTFGRTAFFAQASKSEEVVSFLKAEVHLAIPNVVMVPSLDDIQQAINRMIQLTLEVYKSSTLQFRIANYSALLASYDFDNYNKLFEFASYIPEDRRADFKSILSEGQLISRMALQASLDTADTVVRTTATAQFLASSPSLTEIRAEILHYATFEQEIEDLKPTIIVGPVELHTGPLKLALSIEAKAWKMLLCRYLNEEYKKKMSDMISFITEYLKKLSRPIRDLDDVRFAMEALSSIRDNEIQMDMTLGPIEEAYSILNRFEVEVTKEESEGVDTLRYSFNKLQTKAVSVQDELVQVQPKFKSNLLESVEIFREDVANFDTSYDTEGPMVPNTPPQEASNRLQIFQANFDELWRKFVTYSSGEQLFGLPVTDYEVLHKIR
ncbi:unnamed protein product [Caretta caretta]